MSYVVRWNRRSLDALADIWIAASGERSAVSEAADQVDELLRGSPAEQGESRPGDARLLFVPPLAVTFTVSEPQRTVRVLNVRRMKRRSS